MSNTKQLYDEIKSVITAKIPRPWRTIIIDAELDEDNDWMVIVSYTSIDTDAKFQLPEIMILEEIVPTFIQLCDEGDLGEIYKAQIIEHIDDGVSVSIDRQSTEEVK